MSRKGEKMKWHFTKKDDKRPKNYEACFCVLPRNKYVLKCYYINHDDMFRSDDGYGDCFSFNEIKAWISESEMIQDLKESEK